MPTGLLNLHAIWSSQEDRTEVTVWAKNLNDKRVLINTLDLSNLFDTVGEYNSGGRALVGNYNEARTIRHQFDRALLSNVSGSG
jgi:hypothetical protein